MAATVYSESVWEDSDVKCMARIVGADGAAVAQADVSTITYSVFDVSASPVTTVVDGTSLVVSAVVYDTLQTDACWTVDSTGFNLAHTVADTDLANGGHRYRVEYKVTFATGEVGWVVFEPSVRDLQTG